MGEEWDRRRFLRWGGAGVAGLLLPEWKAGATAADRIERIGIQLYTLRRELARDPDGTLARVAEIGFRDVEFAGYPPGPPVELRRRLERLGLRAPSSHVALPGAGPEWDRVLETAATIGQQFVVVAFVSPAERRSLDDWKRIAARFNQAGEAARKHGLGFCYHNHDFEFVPLEGRIPYDVLLSETDPRLVQLELDLYWITRGGRDPLDYFARWPGRFPLVHVKDMDATPRRSFADLGTGIINFARIFRQAKPAGVRHYFYEQDETPGDPFASAAASFRYLRALRF
jgi:sugar phosphate isomerase/epimerase